MNRLLAIIAAMLPILIYADTACISVIVEDENSLKPVSGARVKAWFENKIGWRAWTESAPIITDTSMTDSRGFCRLKGKTNVGHVSCEVETPPKGYYRGYGGSLDFKHRNIFNVWQPDSNVITIKLARVGHPIPMFVKRALFPDIGKPVEEILKIEPNAFSYDLITGDWLPPWGKGEIPDIICRRLPREDCGMGVNGRGQSRPSFRDVVTIDFPGRGNGMVELPVNDKSELKIRTSVSSGFMSHHEQACGRGKDLQMFRTQNAAKCLCFRVRTKYDDKGNVTEAYYGKIYGDIIIGWSFLGVSSVNFLYYLNTTPNDQNLEWDMKNNLCPNPGNIGCPKP